MTAWFGALMNGRGCWRHPEVTVRNVQGGHLIEMKVTSLSSFKLSYSIFHTVCLVSFCSFSRYVYFVSCTTKSF